MTVRAASHSTSHASSSSGMLHRGSRGPEVTALQHALADAGFDPHGFDGSFGAKTEAAVRAFQQARGLTVDGKVGPQTWAALNGAAPAHSAPAQPSSPPTIQQGSKGDYVRWLQACLDQRGFDPHGVDGSFGSHTKQAVVAFQRSAGLPANGVVDAATWAAIAARPATKVPSTNPSSPAQGGIQGMLSWARSMIGTPYASVNPFRFGDVPWDGKPHHSVNGSNSVWNFPKGTRVFDCSGFVVAAYRHLGVDLAARGLASTSTMLADKHFLQPLTKGQLAPGDLIFYQPHNGIGHVVIYLGNGKCIEAAGGVGVTTRDVDWARVQGYRRVPLN